MSGTPEPHGRHDADVVVIGTGAAGLTAATRAHDGGARVLVIDRATEIGGTSAVSGGVLWVPGNHHGSLPADDGAAARRYILELLRARDEDPRGSGGLLVDEFVGSAAEALTYLERCTPVKTTTVEGLADYYFHSGVAGSVPRGRSVEPLPYPVGRELGAWSGRIAKRGTLLSLGSVTTLGEDLRGGSRSISSELERREAEDVRTKGAALVSMLVRGLLDRGVDIELGLRARALTSERGRVTGVRVEGRHGLETITARRGVVLACGGYEWDRERVQRDVGYEVHPLTPPNNVGDGLTMAAEAGAELALLGSYWGQPSMFDPTVAQDAAPVPQFEWARGAPSSFVVDTTGVRFANEALPYHDFAKRIGARPLDTETGVRAWLVFDQRVKDSMRILSILPEDAAPPWVARGDTIDALATAIRVPPGALAHTVARFAESAASGDDELGRTQHGMTGPGRMRALAPPYYALALHPGTIGTNGGPRIDADGRVLHRDGGVVEGLYAVGNAAASPIGDVYPGAGSTLGPAVTFAYRAGRHVSSR